MKKMGVLLHSLHVMVTTKGYCMYVILNKSWENLARGVIGFNSGDSDHRTDGESKKAWDSKKPTKTELKC